MESATQRTALTKRHNHDHYWIEDGILYESYNTIRGMRYVRILDVPGMEDDENISEAGIKYIESEYLS